MPEAFVMSRSLTWRSDLCTIDAKRRQKTGFDICIRSGRDFKGGVPILRGATVCACRVVQLALAASP
jgi:hypothetical protein